MESRADQPTIMKQVVWTYAEGWSADAFGKFMGALLEEGDRTRPGSADNGRHIQFPSSELHRLLAIDDSAGTGPITYLYGFRPHRALGVDTTSGIGSVISLSGGMAQMMDAGIALATISRQVITNADALLKASFWATELHYRQRQLDLDTRQDRRRHQSAESYEADPPDTDTERNMLGSYNRLNQVAVNFAPTLRIFTDDRIDVEKLSYKAVHGSVKEASVKATLWASWTGIMTRDPTSTDNESTAPMRLMGYRMTTQLGPTDPERGRISDRELIRAIEDQAHSEIRLTQDPQRMLQPDTSERQDSSTQPRPEATLSREDLRAGIAQLPDEDRRCMERILANGAGIVTRLESIMRRNGRRSSAAEAMRQIFQPDTRVWT